MNDGSIRKIPWAEPDIGDAEEAEILGSVRDNWLTMGPKVRGFEQLVAEYHGIKHAIAVNNGTAALDVALKLLGIGPGDEVIVPAFTYIATANAVLYQHAKPVLADVEPDTFNLDPADVARKITPRTKVIMPIDYGGQAADYDGLEAVAKKYGVTIIEDGAQSLGGKYRGRKLNTFGEISTLSFHAAKVLTSVEGGMLLTNDDEHARKARIIRNQGEDPEQKYVHPYLGHNYRMTDLHAAVGLAQMRRVDEILETRRHIAERYNEALAEMSDRITLPGTRDGNTHAWFFYAILLENRDHVVAELKERGIDTRVAWPLPVNRQPVFEPLVPAGETFPVAESLAKVVLNLPMYGRMTDEDIDYVAECVKEALREAA